MYVGNSENNLWQYLSVMLPTARDPFCLAGLDVLLCMKYSEMAFWNKEIKQDMNIF